MAIFSGATLLKFSLSSASNRPNRQATVLPRVRLIPMGTPINNDVMSRSDMTNKDVLDLPELMHGRC